MSRERVGSLAVWGVLGLIRRLDVCQVVPCQISAWLRLFRRFGRHARWKGDPVLGGLNTACIYGQGLLLLFLELPVYAKGFEMK